MNTEIEHIPLTRSSPSMRQILIVDDDATSALITQRGLQARLGAQAEVHIASSAHLAWRCCACEHVDLLIVDPHPGQQLLMALIRAVHTTLPHIIVLVLTAYDTPRLRAEMRALEMRYYFAKPIELMYLVHGVCLALGLDVADDRAAGDSRAAHMPALPAKQP